MGAEEPDADLHTVQPGLAAVEDDGIHRTGSQVLGGLLHIAGAEREETGARVILERMLQESDFLIVLRDEEDLIILLHCQSLTASSI